MIVKSSNIGAIKIGFRVGTERLSRYVERFGFGRPTSPDFPGESPGIVWDAAKWTERALASVSMGYQIGVTALQMVSAVGSVAHAGEFVEPRTIRADLSRQPPIRRGAASTATNGERRDGRNADGHHGASRRARDGESRKDSWIYDRWQDWHRGQTQCRSLFEVRLQRLLRRLRSVTESGSRDHRRR